MFEIPPLNITSPAQSSIAGPTTFGPVVIGSGTATAKQAYPASGGGGTTNELASILLVAVAVIFFVVFFGVIAKPK
jgi:hypothetical protein